MKITNTWGYAINGSWTGLTGFLQREEVDIGSTGMFVLKERLSVVNFIAATTSTRCCVGGCLRNSDSMYFTHEGLAKEQ
jgi:hypothetical protein